MKRFVAIRFWKATSFLWIIFYFTKTASCQPIEKVTGSSTISAIANKNVHLFVDQCWEYPVDLPYESVVFPYNTNRCNHDSSLVYYNVVYKRGLYIIDTLDIQAPKGIYGYLTSLNQRQKDSLYNAAFQNDSLFRLTVENNQIQMALKEIEEASRFGLMIADSRIFDESDYTDGTGYRVSFVNADKRRTIKYVTLNVVAYNPVNDKVYSHKYNGYTVSLKGVGPIAPGKAGSYQWEYVWLSDLPNSFKITSIAIQYMDGSSRIIKDPAKVVLSEKAKSTINSY